jgi:hypothetical protein
LGAVSAEIETLQSRSTALNTKLENRRVVEKLLGPAVEEISISPAVVKKISEGPIDHTWIKALEELEKRSKAIENKIKGPDKMLAASDLKPLLEDLTNLVRPLTSCRVYSRLTLSSGHREDTGLPGLSDQVFAFSKYQCADNPTESLPRIQRLIRLPCEAPSPTRRGDWTSIYQYHALVLP